MDSEDDFERYLVDAAYRDDEWLAKSTGSDFHIKLHIHEWGLVMREEKLFELDQAWSKTFSTHDPAERQKPTREGRPKTAKTKKSTLDDKYRCKGMERML